jgi:hypothetical protein
VAVTARRLPCGRDPVEVWDRAAEDRLGAHEQICTFCQGVVTQYHHLAGPVRAWRDTPVEVPDSLLERVMATVRTTLRARTYLPLPSPHGPIRLETGTAAAVLRWATDQVDGIRARTCRIEPVGPDPAPPDPGPPDPGPPDPTALDPGPTDPGTAGPLVRVGLTVAVRPGSVIPTLARQVRDVIRAVGAELLGIDVDAVDITVVDLFDEPEQD